MDPLNQQISAAIKNAFPDAEFDLSNFVPEGDHFELKIKSSKFNGLTMINQHKLVYAALGELLKDGTVHALKLKTTPKN